MVPGLNLRLIAGLIALAVAFGGGWAVQGWRLGERIEGLKADYADARAEAAEKTRKAEEAARDAEQAMQERSDAVAAEAEAKRQAREVVTQTVTKEVIKYVQSPDANQCDLSVGWVRVHDLSATAGTGGVSVTTDTATEFDEKTGVVKDTDALVTVTDNYGRCHETRDRLMALQEWVRETRLRNEQENGAP